MSEATTGALSNTQVGPEKSTLTSLFTPTAPAVPATGSMSVPTGAMSTPYLAKSPTSPTEQTGVASSSLADKTLASQAGSFGVLQANINQHAANKAATPTFNPDVSVTDLLSSKGQPSDFNSRAQLAAKAGITDYVGTVPQNQQLMGYINNPPNTSGSQTGTSGDSSTNSTSTSGTSTSDTSTIPSTGSPGDVYTPQISAAQTQIGQELEQQQTALNQYTQGTLPLSITQQAQIDATRNQFNTIAQMQMVANKSYEGGVALAGARLGTNIQNPTEYLAEQQQAVTDSLNKLNNLAATANKTIADLQQSFQDKDYTAINDNYNNTIKALQANQDELDNLQKRTDDLYTSTRDYNQKAQEFQQSQAQQQSEFEQTQGLEMQKLALQYPGIDIATGQLQPGVDPTSLPGISQQPDGSHVLSMAEITSGDSPGYDLALEKIAKANGYGIIPVADQKTYDQAQGALTGLQSAIASGSLNGNDNVAGDIQDKIASGLMVQLFGTTNPDNISAALGSGGASIPDLKNMTWNDAITSLQNNINSITGSSPEQQTATQTLNAVSSAANNGVSTGITQNPIIKSNMSTLGL